MEEKDIDKRFKAEKDGEYFDPPAYVWDSLEQDLKKNKRKKRFFVWWLAGLLFVLSTSTYLYQKLDSTQEEYSELATSSKMEIDSDIDKSEDIKSNEIQNESTLQSEQNNQEANSTIENQFEVAENRPGKTSNQANNKSSIKKIENSTTEILMRNQSNEYSDINSKTPLSNNSKLSTLSVAETFENKINEENTNSGNYLNGKIENNFLNRNRLSIPTLKNTLLHLYPFSRNLKNPTPSYPPPIKIDNRNLNTITAILHIGRPNFSNVLSGSESISTESDWYSYGLGISYHREIINGLYLGSGINYRQSKRKFNYESEDISLRGYEQRLTTPSIPLEYGKLISEGEQNFSFIDLSLGIKYDVWSKHIKVSVSMAAIFNLQLRSKGKALDTDRNIIRYTNGDNLYQSNIGFGFSPSITVDIPIYKNFNLTLSPNYTSYFQNLESGQLLREMGYSNFGLDLGLSRKF